MGCYDTVIVPCPACGTEEDFQTKSGECLLRVYALHECPFDMLADVNRHAPYECRKCGVFFQVDLETWPPRAVVVINKGQTGPPPEPARPDLMAGIVHACEFYTTGRMARMTEEEALRMLRQSGWAILKSLNLSPAEAPALFWEAVAMLAELDRARHEASVKDKYYSGGKFITIIQAGNSSPKQQTTNNQAMKDEAEQ